MNFLLAIMLMTSMIGNMNIKHEKTSSSWVPVELKQHRCTVHFPQEPVEMDFTAISPDSEKGDSTFVYSSAIRNELAMLVVIKQSEPFGNIFEEAAFSSFLNSKIFPRFFFEPKDFLDQKKIAFEKLTFATFPSVHFQFSYSPHDKMSQDKIQDKIMEGVAVNANHNLYLLFYLSPNESFQKEIAKQMIDSLKIY